MTGAVARLLAALTRLSPGKIGLLASAILYWPALFFWAHPDGGIFLLGGETLKNGGALYRDFWDIKPPTIYLLNAPITLLPRDWWNVGFYALAGLSVAIGAVWGARLAAQWGEKWGLDARFCALCYAVFFVGAMMMTAPTSLGQCESWGNALLPLSLWLWSRQKMFLAGICAGAILTLKPTALLPLFPLLWWQFEGIGSKGIRSLAFAGMGVGVAPLLAWVFLLATGGASAFVEIQREFVAPYLDWAKQPVAVSFPRFALLSGDLAGRALGATLFLFAALRREWWPLWAALGLGLFSIWIQGRGFPYHFQTLLPPFCWLAALGAARFHRFLFARKRGWMAPWIWVPALALFGIQPVQIALVALSSQGIERARALTRFEPENRSALFGEVLSIAFSLHRQKRPGDSLFVWSQEPQFYLASGVPRVTRFSYHISQVAVFTPPQWKAETATALQTTPPRWVVVQQRDNLSWAGAQTQSSMELWRQMPWQKWFRARYRVAKTTPNFVVFERVGRAK